MIIKEFTFPYDPYGTNPACKVLAERHTITPINGTNFGFIIPKAAPYFRKSVVLKHVASGRILIDGVDWAPSHHFEAASSQKPYLEIFGSITILDSSITGTLELVSYQTLGGEFTLDETTLLELLANTQIDPRSTTWDKIVYRPTVFDPILHLQSAEDTYGYAEMVDVLRTLQQSFSTEYSKLAIALNNHMQDHSNPHAVAALSIGLERFNNVYRASLEQVLAGNETNYVVPSTLKAYVDSTVNSFNMRGANGELPFFNGTNGNFNITNGKVQNKLGIVHNAAEWTAQVGARESFADVFNNWRRIAMTGNNPVGLPAELMGWEYDQATDSVRSTINSSSLIGLISPDTVVGDYVFEVELASNNSDDDFIGLGLGLYEFGGKTNIITLMRSTSNHTTSASSRPSLALALNAFQPGTVTLANILNMAVAPTGWAGQGIIKVRARKVGTMLYVTTTEPNGPYLPEVSFDLASRPDTAEVLKGANLGYTSYSQTAATWKTLQRTGAQPPVVGLHDGKVAEWDGAGYVTGTKKLADVIKAGRYYRNYLTKRSYYAEADGVVNLVSANAGTKEVSTATALVDKVVGVDNSNTSYVGSKQAIYKTASNGTISYLGYIEKLDAGTTKYFSPGNPTKISHQFEDAGGVRGGIAFVASGSKMGFEDNAGKLRAYITANNEWIIADTAGTSLGGIKSEAGAIGFIKPDGSYYGHFDKSTGVFQHWGMNHRSDMCLKENIGERKWVDDASIIAHVWEWGNSRYIPGNLRGQKDAGVIAQKVLPYYPECVSKDSSTGILTVDYSKLAVLLILNQRMKPSWFKRFINWFTK